MVTGRVMSWEYQESKLMAVVLGNVVECQMALMLIFASSIVSDDNYALYTIERMLWCGVPCYAIITA